jgi:hypothetical protein
MPPFDKDRYTTEWLIERHGHRTPAAVRAAIADAAARLPSARRQENPERFAITGTG